MTDSELWKDIESETSYSKRAESIQDAIAAFLNSKSGHDGFTTKEIASIIGIPFSTADKLLRKMNDEDLLIAGKGRRKNRAGGISIVPVYSMKNIANDRNV